jgi:23S rRNA (adenine2503-C2)-methyltransferase
LRDWLIPIKKWSFERMAEYGKAFRDKVDRKITLNFALAEGLSVDPDVLLRHFAPDQFLIKVTPVNTTFQASRNEISSIIPSQKGNEIVDALRSVGYTVILSIGELAENYIGSNCGQYVTAYQKKDDVIEGAYTYKLERL